MNPPPEVAALVANAGTLAAYRRVAAAMVASGLDGAAIVDGFEVRHECGTVGVAVVTTKKSRSSCHPRMAIVRRLRGSS